MRLTALLAPLLLAAAIATPLAHADDGASGLLPDLSVQVQAVPAVAPAAPAPAPAVQLPPEPATTAPALAPAVTPDMADRIAGAIEARDWQGLGLMLLPFAAWLIRRFQSSGESWVHTRYGALGLALGAAVISSLLDQHVLSLHALVAAVFAAGATLFVISNPSAVATGVRVGALLALLSLTACGTIGPVICGPGKVLVPPDAKACTQAVLAAAASVASDVAACSISPASAACINSILASGAALIPCEPTCAPGPAPVGARSVSSERVRVGASVLRTNVIESLRANGYPEAGK